MKERGEQYSKAEAKRRFEQTLRGALNTPPKPHKTKQPRSQAATSQLEANHKKGAAKKAARVGKAKL